MNLNTEPKINSSGMIPMFGPSEILPEVFTEIVEETVSRPVVHKEGNFYRINHLHGSIYVDVFHTWKKTPSGTWIHPEWTQMYEWYSVNNGPAKQLKFLNAKFVLDNSRKKYAYPSLEEAYNSFKIRVNRRLGYLERDLDFAKEAERLLNKYSDKLKQGCSINSNLH